MAIRTHLLGPVLAATLSVATGGPAAASHPSDGSTPTPAAGRSLPPPAPCTGCWIPPAVADWQWQLSGRLDLSVDVPIYDVDLFDTSADVVTSLHDAGRHVVCYLDAGTWENWRPDASRFPPDVLGRQNGWPGERWLDVRRLDVLGPIMDARLDLCAQKGFDSAEFDNVDGYQNPTGFPLTAQDQLAYDTWLANEAHARGLSAALKNDVDQSKTLLPYFDWSLDEQCFQYRECEKLAPFVDAGKAVMEVEYRLDTARFCPDANQMDLNSMKKRLGLGAYRVPCR